MRITKNQNKLSLMIVLIFMLSFVSAVPANAASLNKKSVTIKYGKTFTLKFRIKYPDSENTPVFSSTNKKIATVNSDGVIKAKKVGTCKINVKYKDKTYACKVNVVPYLDKTKLSLSRGQSYIIELKGASKSKVKFYSSNTDVATVSKGIIRTKNCGSCKIKAKYKNKTYTCNITVSNRAPKYGDWSLENQNLQHEWVWTSVTVYYEWNAEAEDWLPYSTGRFGNETKKDLSTCSKIEKKVILPPSRPGKYNGEKTDTKTVWIYLDEGRW